jgi:imidazole glycerol phosphate synthase glutamine amidotransferase subunit
MKAEFDLVDIKGGNIGSVKRCLERLEVKFNEVGADHPPDGSRPLIVPGVGAFGAVMDSLKQGQLDTLLPKLVRAGTPYLGICVGMQILFDGSEESKNSPGLGLIPGKVVRFQHAKVPQIGWNKISARQSDWQSGYVYFVNSYYAQPTNDDWILYQSNYGDAFCAAVEKDNITAFQFHPEKSGPFGVSLIKRWLANVSK